MIIRKAQMQAFSTSSLRAFENEMLAHLAAFSPPLFRVVKEDQMLVVIRSGISRAERQGITLRGPLRLYLELMLQFGSHFDEDPQYPWAAQILGDLQSGPEMRRAERLYDKVKDYRAKVAGADDVLTVKALRKLSVVAQEHLAVSAASLPSDLLREMTRIYPEKASYVGEVGMKTLIDKGLQVARGHEFLAARTASLPVVLMFAFGHGCFEDPLYPWIQSTIEDGLITDAEKRAQRLEKKALTWLDHVLAYFDGGEKK